MVDSVKCRAEVEKDECRELPSVDCLNDITVNDEHGCLCRMMVSVSRLSGWKQVIAFTVCNKMCCDATLSQFANWSYERVDPGCYSYVRGCVLAGVEKLYTGNLLTVAMAHYTHS